MQFLNNGDREYIEENPQDVLEEMIGSGPVKEDCGDQCVESDEEITLDAYFRASYPLLWIRTEEDQRAVELIRSNLKKLTTTSSKIVWGEFKHTTGLLVNENPGVLDLGETPAQCADTPVAALQYIHSHVRDRDDNPVVLVMHNMNALLKLPIFIQQLKDTAYYSRLLGCHVILVGAVLDIPPELKSMITVYDLALPNKTFFERAFSVLANRYRSNVTDKITEEKISELSSAAVGMTALQGENAIALSISARRSLDPEVIQLEKEQAIKRNEVLEFVHNRETIDDLGGWYEYKSWIEQRREALTPEAIAYGLKFPKGVLISGVPGCGKSLAARVTSTYLKLPLLKFDVGKVFQSLVGQSEATIRAMAKTAEAVAPVVLWIEEIEKSAAGSQSSGSSDSGTTARVMATLLTWMQETTKPIFFFATCNNVDSMPPELYRKGRFTEIWGVAEPDREERKDIWEIKLKAVRPQCYSTAYDYQELVDASAMYTGAEIEVAVENAMFAAFDDGREFETSDLVRAITEMKGQHITAKKAIDRTREWMKTKVRMVSSSSLMSSEEQKVQDGWNDLREIRSD
jgi:ATP-dependent 26S proteasome regulatory subunit